MRKTLFVLNDKFFGEYLKKCFKTAEKLSVAVWEKHFFDQNENFFVYLRKIAWKQPKFLI